MMIKPLPIQIDISVKTQWTSTQKKNSASDERPSTSE